VERRQRPLQPQLAWPQNPKWRKKECYGKLDAVCDAPTGGTQARLAVGGQSFAETP